VTINNNPEPFGFWDWNEYNVNALTRNNWRASLVPAAAVIPAPIAYIKVVAVKTLVVESDGVFGRRLVFVLGLAVLSPIILHCCPSCVVHSAAGCCGSAFYLEEIRVFKAGEFCLNTLAWDNRIGLLVLFCWFPGPE
jgi:hypothetical protein